MSRRTPERVRVTTHSLRILLPQTSKVTQQPNIPRFPDTRVVMPDKQRGADDHRAIGRGCVLNF